MNNNSSKQILLSVIGVAILVVAVVGVSFAFFSYVNKGTEVNEVQTGTIIFKSSTSAVELSNLFPNDAASAGTFATVSVSGETTYAEGIEFQVVAKNVRSANNNIIPTVIVEPATVSGVTITEYYDGDAEGAVALANGTVLAQGIIKGAKVGDPYPAIPENTQILAIKAYYDETKYHISDNPKSELTELLPEGFDGAIISTTDWNAMNTAENGAYSFTIDIYATQTGSGRLKY